MDYELNHEGSCPRHTAGGQELTVVSGPAIRQSAALSFFVLFVTFVVMLSTVR